MTAIVALILTIIAIWAAQQPTPWFAARGAIGWIAWIVVVAIVWAFGMLVVLVRATIASIEENLTPDVPMTPVGEEKLPEPGRVLANEFASLGMTRATPPLQIALTNQAVMIGFVQDGADIAGTVYSVQPPGGRPPVIGFDFVSRFEGSRGGLTTSAIVAGSILKATPGALRQVFPGEGAAALFKKHREALDWLRSQGVRAMTLRPSDFDAMFRTSRQLQHSAFRKARLAFALTAIWRTVRKTTPHLGPVQQQPAATREIAYVLGRR